MSFFFLAIIDWNMTFYGVILIFSTEITISLYWIYSHTTVRSHISDSLIILLSVLMCDHWLEMPPDFIGKLTYLLWKFKVSFKSSLCIWNKMGIFTVPKYFHYFYQMSTVCILQVCYWQRHINKGRVKWNRTYVLEPINVLYIIIIVKKNNAWKWMEYSSGKW